MRERSGQLRAMSLLRALSPQLSVQQGAHSSPEKDGIWGKARAGSVQRAGASDWGTSLRCSHLEGTLYFTLSSHPPASMSPLLRGAVCSTLHMDANCCIPFLRKLLTESRFLGTVLQGTTTCFKEVGLSGY